MPDDLFYDLARYFKYAFVSLCASGAGWLLDDDDRTSREVVGAFLAGILLGVLAGNITYERSLTEAQQWIVVAFVGIVAPWVVKSIIRLGSQAYDDSENLYGFVKSFIKGWFKRRK